MLDLRKRELIRETFQNPFDKKRFHIFIKDLLNYFDDGKSSQFVVPDGPYLPDAYREHIQRYERLGKYLDPEGNTIDILIVHLKKEKTLETARSMQRNFTARYLNGSRGGQLKDAALVAFVAPSGTDWRFSLVKMEYKLAETPSGKVKAKEEFTPARRWSFLVGKNENSHTAQSRLAPIMADDDHNPTLAQLEEAFNIEKVTREFFEKYRDLFIRAKEALDRIIAGHPTQQADFKLKGVNTVDFAKKLLGQIIFLYFLQKKGWFGVGRDALWGSGSKQFLRKLFEKKQCGYGNFFNEILEPLFYEALRNDRSHDGHYYSRFNCKIPFLNGGLFDPLNDYDWVHQDILLPNELFSNSRKTKEGDTGDGILDVFDRYNFTVKEDEPLEKEVAIDPELLGKAYEKFNAIRSDNFEEYFKALKSGKKGEESKFNKQFGVYYTPREIVHYMCQQSLIYYLSSELSGKLEKEDIETLILHGDRVRENEARVERAGKETETYPHQLPESIQINTKLIDEKLADITVCDPAVGSGAFPVGMMSEIVKARAVLSEFIKEGNRTPYDFKRQCIEHSLYGVDIDPGAVEIAKLRLWLSLVVDEDDIEQVKPLPNLDYKIICGNSLLGVEKNLFNHKLFAELEKLKPLYFYETNPTKKQEYKKQIDLLINQITNGHAEFDFEVYFSEVFHQKGGFDVVIGNPPYIKERDSKDTFDIVRKSILGKLYSESKMDYWYYFLHRAIELSVKNSGVITFITSRYWIQSSGARKLISHIKQAVTLFHIVDIGDLSVFENVAGYHMVHFYLSKPSSENCIVKAIENSLDDIDKWVDTESLEIYSIEREKLFSQDGKINLAKNIIDFSDHDILDTHFNISQGVVQNPDKVSSKAANLYGISQGDGVFVLTKSETCKLGLTTKEKVFLKPFYDEETIEKYYLKKDDLQQLLYITHANCKSISEFPNIKKHLYRFKKIMDARRETINGTIEWFHLHWPRDQIIFESKKIAFPSMFREPKAVFLEESAYFGLGTNIITSKRERFSLKALTGILNSRFAHYWFVTFGKHRGAGVDIGVDKIRHFPLPNLADTQISELTNLVDRILTAKYAEPSADTSALEEEIDRLVYGLYGLTEEEIAVVEETVRNNMKSGRKSKNDVHV